MEITTTVEVIGTVVPTSIDDIFTAAVDCCSSILLLCLLLLLLLLLFYFFHVEWAKIRHWQWCWSIICIISTFIIIIRSILLIISFTTCDISIIPLISLRDRHIMCLFRIIIRWRYLDNVIHKLVIVFVDFLVRIRRLRRQTVEDLVEDLRVDFERSCCKFLRPIRKDHGEFGHDGLNMRFVHFHVDHVVEVVFHCIRIQD